MTEKIKEVIEFLSALRDEAADVHKNQSADTAYGMNIKSKLRGKVVAYDIAIDELKKII